jgi:SAM-dependent methyltransferase
MTKTQTKPLGFIYRFCYKSWRALPVGMRNAFQKIALLRIVKVGIRDSSASLAGRDDIYNKDYYNLVDSMAATSVGPMVKSIIREYHPKRVSDVGCGTGALLNAFRSCNIEGHGFEYSAAALRFCEERGLSVTKFDVTNDVAVQDYYSDVVVSTEVAEHVEEVYADKLIDFIVSLAPVAIFTAAVPGQGGGTDHVNEQPHDYWIRKFADRGYRFLDSRSLEWRGEWQVAGVDACYWRNVMIFEKKV